MNDCLLTKLKATVDNSSLKKLGEIKIIRTAGLDVVRLLHERSFIDYVKKYYADIEGTNS